MEFGKKRIFLVDMLAGDHGHLLNDDLVLSRCLFPLASRFCLASSSASIMNVHNILGVNVQNIGTYRPSDYLRRLRLIWLAITLNCSGFDHIFLQSFEEISALLFMFLRPAKKVHLVVTNNLRPDRLARHPFLGSWVLRSLIKRATSLIVHSKFEKELILKLSPKTRSSKIYIKPFHMFATSCNRLVVTEKQKNILFIGPERPHKKLEAFIKLIEEDKNNRFNYLLISMQHPPSKQLQLLQEKHSNIQCLFGFVEPDRYFELIKESMFVFLPHDLQFCGCLSGVLCDAVSSGTAVIAENMPPHDELFYEHGPMGYLTNLNVCDWQKTLLERNTESDYSQFQENMAACRAASVDIRIQNVFRTLLQSTG